MAVNDSETKKLLGHRAHWRRNKDRLGKYGLGSDPVACEIGSEMIEEVLNALLPIIIKYANQITEETSKSELVENYVCSHLAAVWLAKHLEVVPHILVECLGGYSIGMGDSARSVSRAMGYSEGSSSNLKRTYPKIQEIAEAMADMLNDGALHHQSHVFQFEDGFGHNLSYIQEHPDIEHHNGYIRIPLN